jgi:predicted nucleic acid-binding protein
MTAKAFVDSNILIYAHDLRDSRKYDRAQSLLQVLWKDKRGVLSTQVLQEFCVNVGKKVRQPISGHELRETLRDFLAWEIVVNSPKSILEAMELEERYRISFWDALILQAASSAGCGVLYSEDFSHGQEYEGVSVINPFQES